MLGAFSEGDAPRESFTVGDFGAARLSLARTPRRRALLANEMMKLHPRSTICAAEYARRYAAGALRAYQGDSLRRATAPGPTAPPSMLSGFRCLLFLTDKVHSRTRSRAPRVPDRPVQSAAALSGP